MTHVKIFKNNKRTPYLERDAAYSESEEKIARRLAIASRLGDKIQIDGRKFRVTGRNIIEEL